MSKRFSPFFGFIALLLIWQGLVVLLPSSSGALPSPVATFREIIALAPLLLKHAGASLARSLGALALAFLLAFPLGIAAGRIPWVDRFIGPVNGLLFPVPKIALLPVVMLLFGLGNLSKVVIVALVLFFQIFTAVRDGAKGLDPHYTLSITSLGGGSRAFFRFVLLPSLLPRLFTALRIGFGTALAVLFFAETFFTRYGLGYFIMDGWMRLDYPRMFAGIVVLSLMGYLIFRILEGLERRFGAWRG